MSRVRQIHIKTFSCYFFNSMINIKNLDLNSIVIDDKSYKIILIYFICYMTTNIVNSILYFVTKDKNESNDRKNTMKNYEKKINELKVFLYQQTIN